MTPREHDVDELSWKWLAVSEESVRRNGHKFPRRMTAQLSHPDWGVRINLTVAVHPDRGPVPTGIDSVLASDSDEPLTYLEAAALLREAVGLPSLLRQLAADASGYRVSMNVLEQLRAAGEDVAPDEAAEVDDFSRLMRELAYESAQPTKRHALTDAHLARVAAVYREALDQGKPPTKAVQETFQIAHSTAAKWVWRARKAGALGDALGTRPGEDA